MAEGEGFSSQLVYIPQNLKPDEIKIYDEKNKDIYVVDDYTKEYTLKYVQEIKKKNIKNAKKVVVKKRNLRLSNKRKKEATKDNVTIPNLVNKVVYNNEFGKGYIKSQRSEVLTIEYNNGIMKKYVYPLVVEKGTIRIIEKEK